ncbi:DUF1433 domain-containing protein [Terribacillus saccharophilus]|uniref:hypothetical protein n=1 Tax=Terribacillus saccharophilus TaxID=361277 RepID=UPI002989B7AD|nr:hypothetical protein [Terribacillus saccharophilus]MCM3227358.1 DUF1433 domain-containing protein [Terribacillus saccharophilus]
MNDSNSKYDEETNAKAKITAEEYIKENYKDIVSIEMGDLYEAPMGSLTIDGTVNNGAGFSISFNKDISVSRIGTDEGFPERK